MKKTFKVVMLPTKKASRLFINDNELCYRHSMSFKEGDKPQHLYIISDKEGKDKYWGYNESLNIIGQLSLNSYKSEWKKIVASTNKSLYKNDGRIDGIKQDLPTIFPCLPESFIKAYIKAYNEGKPITEVDLEMEYKALDMKGFDGKPHFKEVIKTRPDGSVIVHQSKTFSRTEVVTLLHKALREGCGPHNDEAWSDKDFDDWIDKHL